MNQNAPAKHRATWLKALVGLGLGIVLLFISAYLLLFHAFFSSADLPLLFRPLPSDEDMIANFHKHRTEFERLVRIYQQDPSIHVEFDELIPTPEIETAMGRINVSSVRADGHIWIPPDPYSRDLDVVKRLAPTYFQRGDYCHLSAQSRKLSGVKLSYACGTIITFEFNLISKGYYYVPIIPEVYGETLRLPTHPMTGYRRIAGSLNGYPSDFKQYDCLCRQIEPHWFIEMCRR
jgi:hypothetical protein